MAERVNEKDESELLALLEDHFNSAEEATQEAREQSERARDYYDGKQWTEEELEALKRRNQPAIVDNMIKDKVDWLLGMERRARTDPKAYPRNPQDEESAEAATDCLRYIADDCDFDQVKSSVAEDFFIEGSGFCEVVVKEANGQGRPPRVLIRHIRWDRMFYDPHSLRHDFTDAQYMGQAIWMDTKKAQQKWPDYAEAIDINMRQGESEMSETYSDKPTKRWVDPERKRIRIIEEYYKRDGTIYRCVYTKGVLLEGPTETVYRDDEGEPVWPYEGISAYVDRDGNRYGVVKRYLDPQDEVNHRRSKALHILSVRQVKGEKGAVDDVEVARSELSRADGYIETNPGLEFEVLENTDLASGQFQLLQDAKQTLAMQGPNESLVQGGGSSESGRSRQIRQESSSIQLGPIFDRLRLFQRRTFRKAWGCVREFWKEEAWIRVTDDERKLRFVPLNKPVTRFEAEMEQLQSVEPQSEEEAAQVQAYAERLQQMQTAPEMQQVVGTRNNVAELDMDIILDEQADTVTLQSEQFEELVGLAQSGIPIPPDLIIEASSLRNKDRLLEMLKASQEGNAQMQQMAQQLEMQTQEVENLKTQSEAMLNEARSMKEQADAAKAQAEAMFKQIEAALATGQIAPPQLPTEHTI